MATATSDYGMGPAAVSCRPTADAWITYNNEQTANYVSRMTPGRLATMARVCQLLRHDGLQQLGTEYNYATAVGSRTQNHNVPDSSQNYNALVQQQRTANHNVIVPEQEALRNHNVLGSPAGTNQTMSSDSSLDSHVYAKLLLSPPDDDKEPHRRVGCETATESEQQEDVMCDHSNPRLDVHGDVMVDRLSGRADLEGVCRNRGSSKEELVMGKAIVKLTVLAKNGSVYLHVMHAKHLNSRTTALCNSEVRVSLGEDDSNPAIWRSHLVSTTNHPTYDDEFSFELSEKDTIKRLHISVWHTSMENSDEFLGCMSFGINNIVSNFRRVDGWYYLLKRETGQRKHLRAIQKKT